MAKFDDGELLTVLDANPTMTPADLAKHFHCHPTTIYRRLNILRLQKNASAARFVSKWLTDGMDILTNIRMQEIIMTQMQDDALSRWETRDERRQEVARLISKVATTGVLDDRLIPLVHKVLDEPDGRQLAIKAETEIRALSDQYITIQRMLYEVDNLATFQNAFLQIAEASDDPKVLDIIEGVFRRLNVTRMFAANDQEMRLMERDRPDIGQLMDPPIQLSDTKGKLSPRKKRAPTERLLPVILSDESDDDDE